MTKNLLKSAAKLQYFFSKPSEIRVHIGAHKTATTHLQDTLELCENELENMGISYINRDKFRNKIAFLTQENVFQGSRRNFFEKRYTLTSKLFQFHGKEQALVLSEENIMGNALEALFTSPYPTPKLNFINYAKKLTGVQVFISLRSFSAFYPGAYITALRFNPLEAMHRKDKLLERLSGGELPSWVEVVKRFEKQLQNCNLRCWTFDDYLSNMDCVVTQFLGRPSPELPKLPKTVKTATPSVKAIHEIESVISERNFILTEDWRNQCDRIFRKYAISENNPKYTFLSEELKFQLDEQFSEDIFDLESMGLLV